MRTRLRPGDRVTIARGKKQDTHLTPGAADLAGVQCAVVDEPLERVGSVDGRSRGRVTVRPILPSAGGEPHFGMPLDVPMDNLRRESSEGYFSGLAGSIADVGRALVGRGRATETYRGGKWVKTDLGRSIEE